MGSAEPEDYAELRRAGVVRRPRRLIDDPADEVVSWPLVSVDDHLLESPTTFAGRLEQRFAEDGPRIVEDRDGLPYWQIEGRRLPIVGGDGSISWSRDEETIGQVRFDEMRRAVWDPVERVQDMDRCGIAASLCFPSMLFGFAGRRFAECDDPALGIACVRAYNDWMLEEWCGAAPDRFIPSQLPQLLDIDAAVAEIYRNADRGFRAVSFSENPEKLGLSSIHSGYWDPFLAACEETATVVNLHVGSSSLVTIPSSDSPPEAITALFQLSAISAAIDWLYSGIPLRFPGIKLVLSEGGIGWVPGMLDRIAYIADRYPESGDGGRVSSWHSDLTPVQALMRNFWFTAIDDPAVFELIARYPAEWTRHFMTEVDYPHGDTTWPTSQQVLRHQLDSVPAALAEEFAYGNACDLYRWDRSAVSNMFSHRRVDESTTTRIKEPA